MHKEVPAEGALLAVQEKVSESIRCQAALIWLARLLALDKFALRSPSTMGGTVRETSHGFIKMREVG